MKTLRILLLLAVLAVLAVVASDYFGTRRAESASLLAEPEEIPRNLDSKVSRWTWSQSSANQRKVEIHADTVAQVRDTTLLELEGVELLIYHEDAQTHDRIIAARARFDGDTLYSEGDATVLLGVPRNGSNTAESQPTTIRSSGVTFSTKTGAASTERYTEYEFDGGSGHSTGAFYDSVNRYFRMAADAYLEMGRQGTGRAPMSVRAGELFYFEEAQRVDLKKGASLEHGSRRLEASEAAVFLEDGIIRRIDADDASGVSREPSRVVVFETPRMEAIYSPDQTLERVAGSNGAVMKSETGSAQLTARGNRVELAFAAASGSAESLLRDINIRGSAILEVVPQPASAAAHPETRRVMSEILHLRMGEGGDEIEFVETLSRGRLELLPQSNRESRKLLDADRIKMLYAARNVMRTLQATGNVSLQRHPVPGETTPLLQTYSGGLIGEFAPESGALSSLRQWADFRFEQGNRQGNAGEAEFDLLANQIELRNGAQVWDPSGKTTANRLVLDDESGEFQAHGKVTSVYHAGRGGDFFSAGEPVYAAAEHMISNQRTGKLEYDGQARLWQGVDRIEAEHIEIERHRSVLTANGSVVSVLTEKNAEPEAKAPTAGDRSLTEVRAQYMRYEDSSRRVDYREGVHLRRGGLRITCQRLEAELAAADEGGSRLKTALATGDVVLTETPLRRGEARSGYAEAAEFYPEAGKVILEGNPASVVSPTRDTTRGAQLTYFIDDDRLLVLGSEKERSIALRRKRR